jgi:hypothetical protein
MSKFCDIQKFKSEYWHQLGTQFDNAILEMEKDRFCTEAVSLDRIKSLRDDAVKYRDDKANDFVDFEVGAINGVIALIDRLIAEAEIESDH